MYRRMIANLICFAAFASTSVAQPDTLWTRHLGTSAHDFAFDVIVNKLGYLTLGVSDIHGQYNWDFYLVQTNNAGDTLWTRTYGEPGYDVGYALTAAGDETYVLAGVTSPAYTYDIYLVKVAANGFPIWTRIIDMTDSDWAYSISPTTDGGFILAGTSYLPDSSDQALLLKVNALGQMEWYRRFGGVNSETGWHAEQTSDGGYILAGESTWDEFGSHGSVYVVKTTSSGSPEWIGHYGGPRSEDGHHILETADGGFLVAGRTNSYGNGDWDAYFIKLDSNGDTLWTRTSGGSAWDHCVCMAKAADGDYVAAGYTYSFGVYGEDVYIVKISPDGDFRWTMTVGQAIQDEAFGIARTYDNGFILAGRTYPSDSEIYLVRLASGETAIYDTLNRIPDDISLLPNYPNPFNASTRIRYRVDHDGSVRLAIYDIIGNRVEVLCDGVQQAGEHIIAWNAEKVSSGVYFARLETGAGTKTVKMMILK